MWDLTKLQISKEEIAALPPKQFDGKIVLVENTKDADKACQHIRQFDYIGIDTETKPTYQKGQYHPVALLQISTPDQVVYLFHLLKLEMPQSLIQILERNNLLKIGIAIRDDMKALVTLKRHTPKGFIELTTITKELKIINAGAKGLTALLLGFKISKSQQRSNWGIPKLSPAQINYAATDAWICSEMYHLLKTKNLLPDDIATLTL